MKIIDFGVWVWGAVTVLMAIFFLSIVVLAGFYIEVPHSSCGFSKGAPGWLVGLFYSLKENGSLVAGILGFSGLAWVHFFKVSHNVS
ncbi:hypothetical protein [Chromobacterium sp. IRSSSOUMB001]|uniref:hypothetical protein n=1 Tax=Chromobacterium sp. IRSSSOUMB001 TaxID=2927123 RepID=UPI0020BF371A|nr:hypothetical protein [Chromobacterium sp. IRSSSOUMB001]